MFINFLKKNLEKKSTEELDITYIEETLGSLLKNKRIEAKIDIDEISKILKVRVVDINFLENNHIENISKNIYIPGFILSYAKILKLEQKLIEQKIQELSFRPNIDNKKHTLVNIGEYKDLSPRQEISLHSFLIFIVLFLIAIFYYNWHIKSRQYINHQHLIEELKKINEISSSNFDNKTTNQ